MATYLRDAHANGITHGITQGDVATPVLRARADARELEYGRFVDFLTSLAEYIGVLDVESAEQHGSWGENLHCDPQAVVRQIEASLGISIVPPVAIGSLFGIPVESGILSGRDLMGLYTALRVKSVCGLTNLKRPIVCEIGAGLGLAAYYSILLGSVRSYKIVDLPLVNLLQGYFLIRSLPIDSVRLFGESENERHLVNIIPSFSFEKVDLKFDLLLNVDSMPEMHLEHATAYLRRSQKLRGRWFLSINQEAGAVHPTAGQQMPVKFIAQAAGLAGSVYRFREWLRQSYVEELFAL